ncbi:MAG: hypothetical protein Q8N31_13540 [Reyranella sp.]|nr:hypothetical protein [Reyranella sp.]MDP3161038.1 hypothetical protein [Reyranella sp.]
MSDPRAAFSIFCDDIRLEAGNKLSFMGVYGSEIIFSAPSPVTWPKLCIVTWLICDVDDLPKKVNAKVYAPNSEVELASTEMETNFTGMLNDGAVRGWVRLVLQPTDILLTEEGYFRVQVEADGVSIKAGRLKVRFKPPAA